MTKPKALVLSGDGINCDQETAFALNLAGFEPQVMHTSELLKEASKLRQYRLLALPGGFSYGDEIASGKVLAIKLKEGLKEILHQYVENDGLLLGICNGFQVLVQLGILPYSEDRQRKLASLTRNSGGKFENRWTRLVVDRSKNTPLLRDLEQFDLPIRHGEGCLTLGAPGANLEAAEKMVLDGAALRYETDINGSFDRIAALTNGKGNVFGLMPHPEAFVRWTQHPNWTQFKTMPAEAPPGLKFFLNAYTMTVAG
ncbi:MAG TPA: phosphoribosylformylglycinamidine synthase subunit PurQ [Candidatus Obscuribacterales bacterium]